MSPNICSLDIAKMVDCPVCVCELADVQRGVGDCRSCQLLRLQAQNVLAAFLGTSARYRRLFSRT